MKTCILFDLDGTLLDTLEDLTDATNHALARFGCPSRSPEHIRSIVGNGALRQMTLALPGLPGDPDPQDVLAVYKPYYQAHCDIKTHPYPGIPQALETLRERYPVGIVTNKPHGAAVSLCARHFPGVYTLGEEPGCPRKPAPDMVCKAMADLNAEHCVYVGDSEVDLLTAKNAGVPCLSVLWGFRDRDALTEAGARYFCDAPEELPAAVEKILSFVF